MKPKTGYTGTLLYQKSTVLLSQILLLFLFVSPFVTKAQFYKPSEKSIRLGEALPEAFYQTTYQAVYAKTGQPTTLRLADFRNKLIILDFWATWCKPCIGSLNRLDTLRMSMDTTGFVVIPVTYQTAKEASLAFKRFTWDMTSVVGDTTLAQIFPHSGIPHQVWIKDGKVFAIPLHYYATRENIEKTIKGESSRMRMVRASLDASLPLFLKGNGGDGSNIEWQASIAAGDNNYATQKVNYAGADGRNILMGFNLSLYSLFCEAFKDEIDSRLMKNEGSGLFVELGDSLKKRIVSVRPRIQDFKDPESYQQALDRYVNRFSWSYCLTVPVQVQEREARKMMQHDLNAYFQRKTGIEAHIEKRPKTYLILTAKKEKAEKKLPGKGIASLVKFDGSEYVLKNAPFSALIESPVLCIYPDVILEDKTGIDHSLKIDFTFPKAIKGNLRQANHVLKQYGLRLKKEIKPTAVLVIREYHPVSI